MIIVGYALRLARRKFWQAMRLSYKCQARLNLTANPNRSYLKILSKSRCARL
jgi:hypothetical protein